MTLLGLLAGSAAQARLSKRQNSDCADFGGPVECSSFSQSALDDVAFENPSQFVTDYCGATCGQPLYDYYKQCDEDTGNSNATKLDVYCAENGNGDVCIDAIFTDFTSGSSGVLTACANVSSDCSPECTSSLSAAQSTLGCCLYSYYAVVAGPIYAATLFNLCEINGDFCTGGLSNETLVFREDIDVHDECKDLVSDVPERCRYLLGGALLESYGFLDVLCDGDCSNAVYQFYSRCDEVTGQDNSTQLDFLCANNNVTRCGDEIISAFSAGNPLDACGEFNETCPVECTNALQQLQSTAGCCFYTYLAIADSPTNARNIFQLCGVEIGEYCTGHFTNETIDPSEDRDNACPHLAEQVPSDCRYLLGSPLLESFHFLDLLCDGDCANAVYLYYSRCDDETGQDNSTQLDFLCAKNNDNKRCGDELFAVFSAGNPLDACGGLDGGSCPVECMNALLQLQSNLGCCFYTYLALDNSPTNARNIFALCGLDSGDFCTGRFTNQTIDPSEDRDNACPHLAEQVPSDCRYLLGSPLLESFHFLDLLCDGDCANAVYLYYSRCDDETGQDNSTQLDFLCAKNNDNKRCGDELFAVFSAGNPLDACGGLDGGSCPVECMNALLQLQSNLGCCFYTYLALDDSPTNARNIFALCGLDSGDFCTGRFTNQTIDPSEDRDIACPHLAEQVPSDCRYLLGGPLLESFHFLDLLCDGDCANAVYLYYSRCDNETGQDNSTLLDFLCAKNNDNKRCGDELFALFSAGNPLDACEGLDGRSCPVECMNALLQLQSNLGCCFYTYLALDDSPTNARNTFAVCGLNSGDFCTGRFTNQTIDPSEDPEFACKQLAQELPSDCQSYTSIETLMSSGYANPDFISNFCNSNCAMPVYDYYLKCDMLTRAYDAPFVDFLCAKNSADTDCAGILTDTSLFAVFGTTCEATTDKLCTDDCSDALQQPTTDWGCCLFTFTALNDNITYIEGIVEQCKLPENIGLCTGAFSGGPVKAPAGFVDSDGTCEKLAAAIPEGCDEFTSEVAILELAYSDPTALVSNFCKSGCAKPIFEYVKNCFKLTRDSEDAAAYIDFFCSSDSRLDSQCAGILSDEFVSNTVESLCQDATANSCSDACSIALQESSGDWGCCLYTLHALDTNVTFVNDILDRCKVESPGLCEGALSGAPISAPGIEDAALTTAVSSAMLVATAMLLALVF